MTDHNATAPPAPTTNARVTSGQGDFAVQISRYSGVTIEMTPDTV